jgi:hypothetical protein
VLIVSAKLLSGTDSAAGSASRLTSAESADV